jgi:rubrerythrin
VRLHTSSEVISLAKEIESRSARFYENLAEQHEKDKENKKNIIQFERAYYGVISDAIEGCFTFDIEPSKYAFGEVVIESMPYKDAINSIIEMEEKIIGFYSDASEQSQSLMADVSRVFQIIAERRSKRKSNLVALC